MALVVIGLDGASFELINPWIEAGILPNLKKMKENGVRADLESCLPPVTSPNWKCYSTGKNPGKLGIFWWENVDRKKKMVFYPKDRLFRSKEIWNYLSEDGKRVGVMGVPTTYPPQKVNGFMISGGLDSDDNNFTYPEDLEKRLKSEFGYKVRESVPIHLNKEKAISEIHDLIDIQFKTGKKLFEEYEPDFFQITIFAINVLQHFLWDSKETKSGWQIIDSHLGYYMENGHTVLIMSDHGSNRIEHVININTWLQNQNYLKLRWTLPRILGTLGFTQERTAKLVSFFRLTKIAHKITSKEFREGIPTKTGEMRHEGKTNVINWSKSKVVASGQGPIYILDTSGKSYESFRKKLKEELEVLEAPDGYKLIKNVYLKEEIYKGKYLQEAPDLVIDQAKGVHIPGGVGKKGIFEFSEKWLAENKKHGLFLAYGPGILGNKRIENVSILDLAPTIIHMMGSRLPEDMDGGVLFNIFTENFRKEIGDVKHRSEIQEEKDRITKVINGLKI